MSFFTRTTDTDDSGNLTSGTIHNNSWLQAIYDAIENAFIGRSTITTTGNQTALNAGLVRWLYCNNAALLTIQGLTAGVEGQRMFIVSTGAGQVDISDQNASATAANRLITGTSATISLTAGAGIAALVYDGTASRWRVVQANSASGSLTLLKAGSGTSTSAAASSIDTVSISGLTAKDTLLVLWTAEEVTQDVASLFLRNDTDGVAIIDLTANPFAAGKSAIGESKVRQFQSANTAVVGRSDGGSTSGNDYTFTNAVTFTTAWTGSWTLGLRQGGITAGGTLKWSWSVYKVAGQ